MSKKLTFSGNLALLKHEGEQGTSFTAGNNLELNNGVLDVINSPNFDEITIQGINVLNEINAKYSVRKDVIINDNNITLNLGSIDGLQIPKKETEAVNKKYVDGMIDDFWKQIDALNFVNFKGKYNEKYTYGFGDLVVYIENNENYFYISVKDFNNEKLDNTDAWVKINTPIPNNLVTEDKLNLEINNINTKLDNEVQRLEGMIGAGGGGGTGGKMYYLMLEYIVDTDYSLTITPSLVETLDNKTFTKFKTKNRYRINGKTIYQGKNSSTKEIFTFFRIEDILTEGVQDPRINLKYKWDEPGKGYQKVEFGCINLSFSGWIEELNIFSSFTYTYYVKKTYKSNDTWTDYIRL